MAAKNFKVLAKTICFRKIFDRELIIVLTLTLSTCATNR